MPNFLIISDENYATVLRVGLRKIQDFYPDSRIFLCDWGLSEATLSEIRKDVANLTVLDWSKKIAKIREELRNSPMGIITSFLHRNIPSKLRFFIDRKSRLGHYEFERIIVHKLLCLKECSEIVGNEKIFWFDADVVLMAPIEEAINAEDDLIFTLRRESEIKFARNACQVLNTGVIFFGNDRAKRDLFVDQWITRTYESREYLREQTAATRILEAHGRGVFQQYSSFNHNIDGTDISVKFYPCEIYNFNWIEEAVANPSLLESVKLLHFKGRRHHPDHFRNLMSELRIS